MDGKVLTELISKSNGVQKNVCNSGLRFLTEFAVHLTLPPS